MKSHLHWQKDCQQTAKVNVFEASASAIILPTTLDLKFECCLIKANEVLRKAKNENIATKFGFLKNWRL